MRLVNKTSNLKQVYRLKYNYQPVPDSLHCFRRPTRKFPLKSLWRNNKNSQKCTFILFLPLSFFALSLICFFANNPKYRKRDSHFRRVSLLRGKLHETVVFLPQQKQRAFSSWWEVKVSPQTDASAAPSSWILLGSSNSVGGQLCCVHGHIQSSNVVPSVPQLSNPVKM